MSTTSGVHVLHPSMESDAKRLTLAGYSVAEALGESARFALYRGIRDSDGRAVLVKVLRAEHPHARDGVLAQRELELLRRLGGAGVAAALELGRASNGPVLVLDDPGGEPLRRALDADPLRFARDPHALLTIAAALAATLGRLHAQRVVHKNVKPENILWDAASRTATLLDLEIAVELPRGSQGIRSPDVLEGTLAYISPEQTGRMNRAVDYRSDLYSLGVTLYELATGQLPFDAVDPIELVHAHIARAPTPPHQRNGAMPAAISAIILKLMAKSAEDRYQSVHGLAADLDALDRALAQGGPLADFALGTNDVSDRFQIPQRLYGRDVELERLRAAFDRASAGRAELILVSGSSGAGKSALVQELYARIAGRSGHFIRGKYDQVRRTTPYGAVVSALQDAVRQLLSESPARLEQWREKILAAVGPNGPILVDVIPEIALILGPQPPVFALAPAESQNRFNQVFRSFIGAFCRAEHPLVIFLDDLQWADAASLGLIQLLMGSSGARHLLLIGAYRDDEVSATHPLSTVLADIEKAGGALDRISVAELDLGSLTRLVADTLHWTDEAAAPLSELVLAKTHGNPFFFGEFLKSLHAEDLIRFDAALRGWSVDLPRIRALDVTANVVDLMVRKIRQLPAATQTALERAACVGNRFDAHMLAIASEGSPGDTTASLEEAVAQGMVMPASPDEAFTGPPGDEVRASQIPPAEPVA